MDSLRPLGESSLGIEDALLAENGGLLLEARESGRTAEDSRRLTGDSFRLSDDSRRMGMKLLGPMEDCLRVSTAVSPRVGE